MNGDNQYPNGNPNEGPNANNGNQGAGQYNEQDKYWNPNQNQGQSQMGSQNQAGGQNGQGGNPNQFNQQSSAPKKPKSKKLAVSIIGALFVLLLVGGGAFAFFNMQKTPKDQLLLAEVNSWKQLTEAIETRYQPEFKWAEKAETTPTEYTYNIGASVDGEFYSYEEMMAAEIVNNSSLSLGLQMDPNKQLLKADLGADVNGVKIDNLSAYVTTKELMFGFPFTDDILQVKDEDFGNLMRILDPYYEGSDTLGLSDWMGRNTLSEEDQDYLVKEYLLFFYNSLPAEAFTETTEEVDIFGEKLQTTKISMELSGDQIKESLVKVFEKANNDSRFEEIIIDLVENAWGAVGSVESDIDIKGDFKEALEEATADLKETEFSTGVSYTAWVSEEAVVKSALEIEVFKVEGTRQFTTEKQQWDYTVEVDGEKLFFVGDMSFENGKAADEVTLLDEENTGFTYEGSEELNGGDRTFNRTLYFNDGYDEFELLWDGNSSYKGDSIESENTFGINTNEFDVAITVDEAASIIKNVDIPSDNLVDIGAMSEEEMETYMMEDFLTEAQNWVMDLAFELGLF